jgi:pimeloyl-ACP methyl ester carboxylesterase
MADIAENVKISERRRGKMVTLSSLQEGKIPSFDGTNLYFRSFGKGNPPIVCCNGLGVGTFFWVYLERAFRAAHQVVTWDYRGHGKSELKKNPKNYHLQALVKDLKSVVDHHGLEKPVLIGHSLGVQVILEFYRRWPEKVGGMILCFGTYGRPMDHFYNTRLSRYLFKILHEISLAFPRESNLISRLLLQNPLSFFLGGVLKVMHTGMIDKKDTDRYIEHLLSVDPTFFQMLLKSAQDSTSEDMLRSIRVPTLIIAGELDQFTPVWLSKKMHRLVPESELFVMHKATHAGLVEQPDLINLRIEKFLKDRVRAHLLKLKKSAKDARKKKSPKQKGVPSRNTRLRLVAGAR